MTAKKHADTSIESTNARDDRGILELAQKHALKLHEELREKTFISLREDLEKYMRKENWAAIKQMLKIAFMTAFERKPVVLMAVMQSDNEFQEYSEYLYIEMNKIS